MRSSVKIGVLRASLPTTTGIFSSGWPMRRASRWKVGRLTMTSSSWVLGCRRRQRSMLMATSVRRLSRRRSVSSSARSPWYWGLRGTSEVM